MPGSLQPAPAFDGSQLGLAGTFAPVDPTGGMALWVGPSVSTGTIYTLPMQGGNPMGSPAPFQTCTDTSTRVVASVLGGSTLAAAWGCGTSGTMVATAPATGVALSGALGVDPTNTPFGMVSVDVGAALTVGSPGSARVLRLKKDGSVDNSVTPPLDVALQGGGVVGAVRRAVAFDGKGLILLTTVGVTGSIAYTRVGCP
jgi:hypothetical protein